MRVAFALVTVVFQILLILYYTGAAMADIADPIAGGSGWVGAGLLGTVLAWLMLKHIPDKDKQLDNLITVFSTRSDNQRKEYRESLEKLTETFKVEAQAERMACEKHFSVLAESMNSAYTTLGQQLQNMAQTNEAHSVRNQQWLDVLKEEIRTRGGLDKKDNK